MKWRILLGGRRELLTLQPADKLSFPFVLHRQTSCSFRLFNTTDEVVAFNVQATHPKKYCVQQNSGLVFPKRSTDVTITMHPPRESPPTKDCKHRFLIQSVTAPLGTTRVTQISQDIFNKSRGKDIHEAKLKVQYVCPPPATTEDGFERQLLTVEPGELTFPFVLRRQASCSFRLFNSTDSVVAYKVKLTDQKKYIAKPSKGLVLPRSSVDVITTMNPQTESPPYVECKDGFLVQSVTAPYGKYTADLFMKEGGSSMDICEERLRVKLVAPPVVDREWASEDCETVRDLRAQLVHARATIATLSAELKSATERSQCLQQELFSFVSCDSRNSDISHRLEQELADISATTSKINAEISQRMEQDLSNMGLSS